MLSPGKLKTGFKKVEDENWILRSFLKEQEPDEIDRLVNGFHKELFEGFDCIPCSNCCKKLVPVVKENDILAISTRLGITPAEFKAKYLIRAGEDYQINKKPCPFLTGKGCSIYVDRPEMCREYPFTHQAEIWSRLINLVANCAVCPIVFEICERLKKYYQDEFAEYQEELRRTRGREEKVKRHPCN